MGTFSNSEDPDEMPHNASGESYVYMDSLNLIPKSLK